MAEYTTNYDLVKPAQEDFYNVDDQNRNMDKIDAALKAHDDSLAGKADLGKDGKVKPEQLPDSTFDPTQDIKDAIDEHNISETAHADIREDVAAALEASQNAQEAADAALEAVSGFVYTIDVVPTQNGSLTYNGEEQTPSWNSYNPDTLTLGGVTTGTDAGTYTATFTPKDPYKWTDGTQTTKQVQWTINRATVATPTQSGSLTYTGSAQSPSWNGYDTSKLTIGGTTSGTNAGSYNATFTPTDNYRWSDGTTGAKTVAWTIGKAAGSLSLSKSTMDLGASKMTDTFTVTRAGDGAISAQSNNPGVATVNVNGTTVTVTAVGKGNATITVSVAEGTNYTAPANKTCSVSVTLPTATLNDNDWDTISEASAAGTADDYWAVGDTKSIVINGNVVGFGITNLTVNVFILGFNHNASREGSNRIHFQIGKIGATPVALCDNNYNNTGSSQGFRMNTSNTNNGGWASSYMRNTVLGNGGTPSSPTANSLMAALPSALRAVMKAVTKYTDNTGGGSNNQSNVTSTQDYLFLLAEFEVFGTRNWANSYEQNYQVQYAYYQAGNSRIAYRHTSTASAVWWWLRSPYSDPHYTFLIVYTGGAYTAYGADLSGGVRPGFCDCEVKWSNRNPAFGFQVKDDLRKRKGTSLGSQSLKLPFDALTRTLLAWWGIVPYPISCVRAKQIRRHPTIYLYERRILYFYDKPRTA